MLDFDRIEVIPVSKEPAKVLIRWFMKPTREVLSDYEFYIDSSLGTDSIEGKQDKDIFGGKSPLGEGPDSNARALVRINQEAIDGTDLHEYIDETPYLRNLHAQVYYRVRCRRKDTQDEAQSEAITWKGNLDLVGLYVVDEHDFLFKDVIGEPCLIYPRRRGGVPCDCFNPVLKQRTREKCSRCFGTNWVGGFYKPISTYASVQNPFKQTGVSDFGETNGSQTNMFFTNYPQLRNGDLVREVMENKLWRVAGVKEVEKRVTPMLQIANLVEVTAGDVEYRIPVDQELIRNLADEFAEIQKKREF